MRVVVQRAKDAKVTVAGEVVGEIDFGLVLLVGITHDDTEEDAAFVADKIAHLRIFEGKNERIPFRCWWSDFINFAIYAVRRLSQRKKTELYGCSKTRTRETHL